MTTAFPACPHCPPRQCPGPVGHAVHNALLALPMPRRELSHLLNTSHDRLPTDPGSAGRILSLITRLPTASMLSLATTIGIDAPTLASVLPPRPTALNLAPDSDTADLAALLLHHHPTPVTATALLDHTRWSLPRLQAAATRLHDEHLPGIALHIDGDTYSLRPTPRRTSLTPPADEPGEPPVDTTAGAESADDFDRDLASDLYSLLAYPALRLPEDRIAALRQAGLVTHEDDPRPTADVRYSLQWWD